MVSKISAVCENSSTPSNIVKEGSGWTTTVLFNISRSVTPSMRRPMDICPMLSLVDNIAGAGHSIREGFMASAVQGWCGCVCMSESWQVVDKSDRKWYRHFTRYLLNCAPCLPVIAQSSGQQSVSASSPALPRPPYRIGGVAVALSQDYAPRRCSWYPHCVCVTINIT